METAAAVWPQEIVDELKRVSRCICGLITKNALGVDGKFHVLSRHIKHDIWRATLEAKSMDRFSPVGDSVGELHMDITVTKSVGSGIWDAQQVWEAIAVHDPSPDGDGAMTKFIIRAAYTERGTNNTKFY